MVRPSGCTWTDLADVVLVHRPRAAALDVHRRLVSTSGPCGHTPPRSTAGAPTDSTAFLSRSDLASHLQLSAQSVDRFIARHRLRSGSGRPALVRLESYARCLVALRRQSTRSMAPVLAVRRDAPAPRPIQPGEELLLVAPSDGSGPLVEALQIFALIHPLVSVNCFRDYKLWA